MARLAWSALGERFYEVGVDRGVLYIDDVGYAWSGLVSVIETPSGGKPKSYYIDGLKYLIISDKEEFEATVNAYYSPKEFDICDGIASMQVGVMVTQQRRKTFGLSYRSKLGNDLQGSDYGYKIHIVYNALADPTDRNYISISNDPDVPVLSWQIVTKPVVIPELMHSSHIIIDSTLVSPASLSLLEDILYGNETNGARLPDPLEVASIFEGDGPFTVTDLGDDEFEITGTAVAVMMIDENTYQITSDTVIILDEDSAEISSA